MPLIRCTSCSYANATNAKVCKKCGTELRVPPHVTRCPFCGSLNPEKEVACVRCYRKLPGHWRQVRGWPTRVVVASMAIAVFAGLGYYAYPRPQQTPRPPAPVPATTVQETPPDTKSPAMDSPRAETPKAKAAPVAAALPQPPAARKAGDRASENCAEGLTALGLCGKTESREPPRPQNCSDAAAALGLCESRTTQGRE